MNINRSPYDQNNEQLQHEFITKSLINKNINTCDWIKVVAVDPIKKTVDVTPLVSQLSANKDALEHSIIYDLPYINLQASLATLIITPVVGDMGLCIYAQNDVSGVQASKDSAPPTSLRTFDYSDGCFIGMISAIAPNPITYIELKDEQIKLLVGNSVITLVDGKITLDSTTVEINASNLNINADTAFTGTLTSNGKNISNSHVHTGVMSGGSLTGVVN